MGRSRGGLSTKIHMVVDARGQPIRFILTGGQAGDAPLAIPLLTGMEATHVIADKGYDSDKILGFIRWQGEVGWEKWTPKSDKLERRRCQDEEGPGRKV